MEKGSRNGRGGKRRSRGSLEGAKEARAITAREAEGRGSTKKTELSGEITEVQSV